MSQLKETVFLIPSGFSGCAFWRFRLPAAKLAKLCHKITTIVADVTGNSMTREELLKGRDVSKLIAIQAPGHKQSLDMINFYKQEGKKVVVDYDDLSFYLSEYNPRYKDLGTSEYVEFNPDGTTKISFRDMENEFDLKSNIEKKRAFIECVKIADAVSTTTEYLADKFRAYNKNVYVLPNSIDFDLWKPIQRPDKYKDQIRIGWFGGDSHYKDLMVLKDVLPRIVSKYQNVRIAILGPKMPLWMEAFKGIPEERIDWHDWSQLEDYTLFLANRHWDIGICPLEDTEFNRCKSNIKYLEFSALKVPSVCQNMLPYNEGVEDGSNILLAKTESDWYDNISRLVEDPNLRKNLSEKAYSFSYNNFNLEKNIKLWENAYLGIIRGELCPTG